MKEFGKKLLRSSFLYFTLMITLKIILVRSILLTDHNPLHSLWFEMSFLIIFIAAAELIIKKGKIIFYIALDLILSLLFMSMLVYERYFGTIPTYYDLSQLNQVGSVNESAMMLLKPMDVLLFADLLLFIVIWLFARKKWSYPARFNFKPFMFALLGAGLVISFINFQMSKNEMIYDNALFAKENGFFNAQFVQYFHDEEEKNTIYAFEGKNQNVTQEKIEDLKGNEFVPMKDHQFFGAAKDRNLIILQVESLQDFVIGKSINGQEITPNINKWLKDSTYFGNVYQQIGSGNTSDAEFLMNTSIYPLGNKATSEEIEGMKVPSLPRMLKDKGYYTVTMHADDIEYWNRDALYPALGFNDHYSKDYYGEEDTVGFGQSDELFLNHSLEALEDLNQKHGKFYSHVITLTSHTPFKMPEDKRGLTLPDKYQGTLTGNYMQAAHYTDMAIGKFFEQLKEDGLWDKSVIALYGDHSGVHGKLLEDEDKKLLKEFTGQRYSFLSRFNIPFIVGAPGLEQELPKQVDTLGGQIDMMPTLLNLLGVEPDTIYFGHDLMHYKSNLLGMRYYVATSSFFNDNLFYVAKNSRFDARIVDIEKNKRVESSFDDPNHAFPKEKEKVLKIMNWSDQYFDSFR